MKINFLTKTLLILVLAGIGYAGFGQEYTKTESSKSLEFTGESKVAEVTIPVGSEIDLLRFTINTTLKKGKALIEIFDPADEVKGSYRIVAEEGVKKGSKTYVKSNVKGTLERQYRDPATGDWMIKITPKDALGLSEIESVMIHHPKADILEIEQIEKISKEKK